MIDEQKIQNLLKSNIRENQLLALELMQSLWNHTLYEALSYTLDFYCHTNDDEINLYVGEKTLNFTLRLQDDYSVFMGWEVLLSYKLSSGELILLEKEEHLANINNRDTRSLKDYETIIKAHFRSVLPNLLQ